MIRSIAQRILKLPRISLTNTVPHQLSPGGIRTGNTSGTTTITSPTWPQSRRGPGSPPRQRGAGHPSFTVSVKTTGSNISPNIDQIGSTSIYVLSTNERCIGPLEMKIIEK